MKNKININDLFDKKNTYLWFEPNKYKYQKEKILRIINTYFDGVRPTREQLVDLILNLQEINWELEDSWYKINDKIRELSKDE